MAILNLFSKRGVPLPDVFVYDELPEKLRVQIVHILDSAIGPDWRPNGGANSGWTMLAKLIAKEHGLLRLPETPTDSAVVRIISRTA